MTTTIPSRQWAPAESLLGKLQRGLGSGYLEATERPREEVWPLLLRCIIEDPCWDRQLEDRSAYYADLVVAVAPPLEALAEHLREHDAEEDDHPVHLTLATLATAAGLGSSPARAIARDYVVWGRQLGSLLGCANEVGPDLLDGLDQCIVDRLDDEAIAGQVVWCIHGEPWSTWSQRHPQLAALAEQHEAETTRLRKAQGGARERLQSLTVAELLGLDSLRVRGHLVTQAIRDKVTPADVPQLRECLSEADLHRSFLALEGLAALPDPAHLDPIVAFVESSTELRGVVQRGLSDCLLAVGGDRVLELGRRWYGSGRWDLELLGGSILEALATLEDVPQVRSIMLNDLGGEVNLYRVCTALEILRRFPGLGPLPEVELAYREAVYCWARWRAVEAMLTNCPAHFADRFAFECLWDSDDRIVLAAASCVALSDAAAARIQELAGSRRFSHDERAELNLRLGQHPGPEC